jgi:serine/threonine protein kinase
MASGCLTEESIAELVEEGSASDRMEAVEGHLSSCPSCRQLVAAAKREAASLEAFTPDGAASDDVLERGARFARYEIRRLVGAGAMGRVYAAYDRVLDRTVALKLLRPGTASPRLERRLLREAKAMARLSHPSVITVFDAGKEEGRIFVVMELVRGGTLREWLNAQPRSWRQVLDVFVRAGRGLAEAHAAGIIHRDFKPDNVLVGDDGRVRVTDFGLARSSGAIDALAETVVLASDAGATSDGAALTRTGALLGTPAYMAPEQFRGAAADERTDVYAFCTALFEALFGKRPFAAISLAAIAREKSARTPPRLPTGREVPPALARVVLLGLRSAPDERPASMRDLLAQLENVAGATLLDRRALRAVVWGVGSLAVALVGLGAYAGWSQSRGTVVARPPAPEAAPPPAEEAPRPPAAARPGAKDPNDRLPAPELSRASTPPTVGAAGAPSSSAPSISASAALVSAERFKPPPHPAFSHDAGPTSAASAPRDQAPPIFFPNP